MYELPVDSMILSPNCKKILRLLRKAPECRMTLLHIQEKMEFSKDSTLSACNYLVDSKRAEYVIYSQSTPAEILLTECGRHPIRSFLGCVFMMLLKGFILPIIVSVSTTLITLYLQGLL